MTEKYRFVSAPGIPAWQQRHTCSAGPCNSMECQSAPSCTGGYLVTAAEPIVVRGRVRGIVWRAADGSFAASSSAEQPDLARLHDLAQQRGGWVQIERLIEGEPGRVLL